MEHFLLRSNDSSKNASIEVSLCVGVLYMICNKIQWWQNKIQYDSISSIYFVCTQIGAVWLAHLKYNKLNDRFITLNLNRQTHISGHMPRAHIHLHNNKFKKNKTIISSQLEMDCKIYIDFDKIFSMANIVGTFNSMHRIL